MSSINLSFCIPKKRQTVEPYIVVTDFLKTSEKECTKFDLKNELALIKKEEIIECIKTVMDPEIPVNLYDLGLIYEIKNIKNIKTITKPKDFI